MKLVFLMLLLFLLSCGERTFVIAPSGSKGFYDIEYLKQPAISAIKQACVDNLGSLDLGLSDDECALILAGSAVTESSWDVNKSCEAWGNPDDPACGLTQSRRSDAFAVGLRCDPTKTDTEAFKCNALTGLRNLRCKADGGRTCDSIGQGRTLEIGIKKHLGSNTAAYPDYVASMETVYYRTDVRRRLGVCCGVRSWDNLFKQNQ